MLNINREDIKIKELSYDSENGDFRYSFDFKGKNFWDYKKLPSTYDLEDRASTDLLEVEFVGIIQRMYRGYGNSLYVIKNLDLIDKDIKDTLEDVALLCD